jgi:hypothetical protein
MKELFYMGGTLFMSILTLILLVILIWSIYYFITGLNTNKEKSRLIIHRLSYLKSFGFFAMITGILGQLTGMYSAFSAIETAGDISKALFFGGLKLSMITPIYGILIFLFSLLLWITMDFILQKKKVA